MKTNRFDKLSKHLHRVHTLNLDIELIQQRLDDVEDKSSAYYTVLEVFLKVKQEELDRISSK